MRESEETEGRNTQEFEGLLNEHDRTVCQTMKNLEIRLSGMADLMMRKFDELFTRNNRSARPETRED